MTRAPRQSIEEAAAAMVERSRLEQGLPRYIEDEATIERVSRILENARRHPTPKRSAEDIARDEAQREVRLLERARNRELIEDLAAKFGVSMTRANQMFDSFQAAKGRD